jgi:hypothetical protein
MALLAAMDALGDEKPWVDEPLPDEESGQER